MKKKSRHSYAGTEKGVAAEQQIRSLRHNIDYQTKDFTLEVLVGKYLDGKDEDANEVFVPTYQRAFVWNEERKSKFIESIILELPIPYIFIATLPREIAEDEGRAEIVDGSQRVRTLAAYLSDQFALSGLEKLEQLNGFKFSDLEISRQRKIKRQSIRVIELSDKANESIRRDIFERINTGSDELKDMEKRKGIYTGPFYEFIRQCAAREDFRKVCPISHLKQRREEAEELVLRYFAYCDRYLTFQHDVRKFLDKYLKEHQTDFPKEQMEEQFNSMVKFATSHLPFGFRKNKSASSVPRVRFEALACGITLAQRLQPDVNPDPIDLNSWIQSPEFEVHVASDASNSLPRLKGRVEYVRDRLLEQ
jgi:hypothetical protein